MGVYLADLYASRKKNGEDVDYLYQLHRDIKYASMPTDDVDEEYVKSFINDSTDLFSRKSYQDDGYNTWSQLNKRADYVKGWMYQNKGSLTDSEYNAINNYLKEYDNASKQYSQFESNDAYMKYLQGNRERTELLNFDTGSAKTDLDDLDSKIASLEDNISKWQVTYDTMYGSGNNAPYTNIPNNSNPFASGSLVQNFNPLGMVAGSPKDAQELLDRISNGQTELAALKKQRDELSVKYNRATNVQNVENLYNNATDATDFDDYSQKGAGNKVAQQRAEYKTKYGDAYGTDYEMGETTLSLEQRFAKYATDDEMSVYNYYIGKGDTQSAQAYLNSMEEIINSRKGVAMFSGLENETALELAFGAAAGLQQFGIGVGNLFTDKDYYAPTATQITSSLVREDLSDVGFNTPEFMGGGSLGQIGYDLINTTANMLPSILTSAAVTYATKGVAAPAVAQGLGAAVGSAVLGASAAGNAYAEMINLGYDKGQARTYAALVGGSEAGLQYLMGGIGKLGGKITSKGIGAIVNNIDNAFAKTAIKFGGQMISEGFEEYAQELLDPFYRNLVFGENNELNLFSPEAIYSGVLGAFTAGILDGVPNATASTINAVSTYNTGRRITKNENYDVSRLIELGSAMSADSVAYKIADKVDKNTGAYTIGKLFNSIGAELSVQNKSDIVKSLTRKGIAEKNANTIADWLGAVVSGAKLSKDQIAVLERNEDVANTFRDVIINQNSTVNQRMQGLYEAGGFNVGSGIDVNSIAAENTADAVINRINESQMFETPISADLDTQLRRLANDTANGTSKNTPFIPTAKPEMDATKAKAIEDIAAKNYKTSETKGETVLDTTNESVSIKKIAAIKGNDMTLELDDGRIVSAKDVSYASEGEALIYEAVANMDVPIPADAANSIVSMYNPTSGQSAKVFAKGIEEAYRYGYYNIPKAEMLARTSFTAELTPAQRETAYKLGNIMGKDRVQSAPTTRTKSAKGRVIFDGDRKHLSPRQKTSLKALEVLAKVTGLHIEVFESPTNKRGRHIGENGSYDPKSGTMRIDLYAGVDGNGVMLYTAAHELVHHIKVWSPAKFKILADFLVEQYGEKGVSVDELVRGQIAKAKANGRTLTYDAAYEEVIADSMESMLADGAVIEKLQKLAKQDQSLVQKIESFLKDLVAKIKEAYKGLKPDSAEGKFVADMLDTTERLQELFTEAIMDASVNYKSAVQQVVESKATPISNSEIITDGAVVTDGEGIKYSIKSMKHDIAEGKMFDDLKQYCGFTNKEINKLKARLEDLVQYMTLNREILDMNETYGREGRRFSPYKPNSDPLYTISLDHSTQCSKRLLTQYVIEQLQLRENRPMSAEEQMAIRDMLKEYGKIEKGIEVACVMCYVEAARLKSPKQINRWLTDPEPHLINYFAQKNPTFKAKVEKAQSDFKISKGYEANTPKKDMKPADRTALDKMSSKLRSQYKPTTVEKEIIKTAKSLPNSTYLTSGNLADLSESHPEIYKAYSTFVRSATRSKPLETDEPYYYGDSTRDNGNGIVVSDSFIETVNRENGMRFSSWSDWRIQHMLDWITAVIENSVRGAAMHGYTKYGDEVRVLGKTGMMFNMSGVAGTQTGLNEDGSLSFSDTESINYDEAIELREQFPETAGLQCIGVSVEHIFALLRSNIIDYVIPYHTSGLNAGLRRMGNIYGWKNFTSTQHATKDSSIKKENAVDPDNWHKEPVFSEFFVGYDTGLNGYEAMKKSAENYKRMCKERGLIPKFAEFANEDNYWKLLIDRKMVNQKTNTLIKQKPVSPVFDFDVIKSIVDKYVENYDSGLEQRALDYVVENWDYLPQRIRDLKKQGTAKAKTTRKAVNTLANETLAAQPNENDLKLSDRDSDYMSAVESGDMETAQRMVDEAAREAGYSVRAMHSTNADFTVFDISKTSANNFHGKGIYFTSSLKDLENNYENYEGPDPWQKIEDRAYELLDEKHGLSYDDTLTGDAEIIDLLNECYDEAIAEFNDSQRRITAYLKFDNPFVFEKGDDINASVDRTVYDGIVDKQVYENIGHSGMDENTVHYIVFNPNNIKSSAPVTYDENGNVIPLSKRFDSSESDIRYSDREIGYGKLTQDRINYLIDDSGAGSNVGYARAWIASINPTDFIDLTINYRTRMKGREAFDNNVRGDYNGLMADRDYISDLQNSRTIPRLKVDMDTGKVIGHDGRHRMRALEKAGASHTPVVIEFYKDDYLYKGNGDGVRLEAIDVQILTSQFDEIPILETHGSIYDIIPLNEDHRTEIEKNYLVKKTDVKYGNAIAYSDRDPDAITPRNLLANALESTAANDIERKKLEQYKKKIDSMNAEEKKLSEIRKEIKELSFGKGKRDTEKLKKLNAEATMTANRIATYDKQLLNLESTQAIKNVLEREKKKAVDRQKARDKEALKAYKEQVEQRQQKIIENYRESRKNATESRHRTEMRNKIKKVVNELNQYLLKGTKDKHVMEGMQKAVAEALSIVNMDTVDADARVAKYDALIAEATDPDVIESLTATRDRIQGQGDRLTDKLASLKSAYADIINSSDPTLSNAYDEVIEAKIASVVETVGDTSLRNMSMAQLEEVYDLYKMVLTNIRNANKLFASEKQGTIEQLGYEVDSEVKTATKQKDRMTAVNSFLRKVGYKDLKPIYFFRMLGSNTMTDLYKKVRDGQGTWFKDAVEARAFRIETERKYNYKQWDLKETYKFTAKSGKSFELTLPQIMSIYAFSRREQAFDHLIKGGIVFDDAVKVKEKKKGVTLSYTVNTSEAFNLSVDTLGEIIDTLTEEQKSYVKDMQSYLSDTMGGKGNEVALELYGVKLFKEKNYFPLKSSQYYMNFTAEEAGETKIKNSSFSKETVKHANNPIVLSDFIDVWANHVNDMSMYHSFVLPLEDFTRVYNYRTPTSEDVETTSVKSTIHNHYTEAANSYIKQLLKDINGGSVSGVGTEVIDKMVGLAKKGAVFASASVVVQQPSAIARAMAYVNPKYFVNVSSFNLKRHNQLWEECKQYAPVAGIKEMGYFDTSVGRTGIDWLKADEYDSVREKFFAFFKDKEQRRNIFDDALGFAPAMADELSWVALWEAVKKETRKTTDLEVGSEEFFKHCGERFTEVVDLTQVYDSVFARSELMRSKDRSVKMATSFMAEPTVQANMLFDAALQLKRGKMSALGSAASVVSAVVASVILNSLLKSFVTAGRDDDEEETYLEKYVASFTGDVINGMNPLTLIPFVKDLVSIVQGYSVDRMDMSVIDDLVTSVMNLGKESETPADDHKKWSSFVGSVAQMFGIPLKNIMRDVESTINIFSTFMSGNKTTSAGIASAIKEGLSGTTTAVIYDKLSGGNGIDVSKGKQYYDAVMNGNQDHANRIIESYGDAKKAETAIVKALKDFDPRVMEAAQAHVNGDTATRIRLTKEIIADGFAMNYVIKAVNNAINSINAGGAGESGGNVKSKYSNTDYFEAAYKGNSLDANAYKEDIIQADMKNNGKTRVEAEDSFNTNFRNLIKDAVEAGQITVEKATIMLTQYGGLSGEEALEKAQYYDFIAKHSDLEYNWQSNTVADYVDSAEPSGISVQVFDKYLVQKSKCKGVDKDGDGKVDSGSKKVQILNVINSLPLSSYQKDVLYRLNGWSASTIYQAPWH